MTVDYWSWLAARNLDAVQDKIEQCAETGAGKRADWMGENLPPVLIDDMNSPAFNQAFERLTLAYNYYDALKRHSPGSLADPESAEHIKAVYAHRLAGGYAVPLAAWDLAEHLGLLPTLPDIALLPRYSALWHFRFALATDYLSKDDDALYMIDNPVRKESRLKLPMVGSTGWKGALRAAYRAVDGLANDDPAILRLFGETREDESGQAGLLYFFPSYFRQMKVIVINPHNRLTGIGARGPILSEAVPAGEQADFLLLYLPPSKASTDEIGQDIAATGRALAAMFCEYGFGAKTSTGFGRARNHLIGTGKIYVHAALSLEAETPQIPVPLPVAQQLPRYLDPDAPDRLHPDFRRSDGTLKSEEEYKVHITRSGRTYGKPDRQLYEKARKWWQNAGEALLHQQPAAPPQEAPSAQPWFFLASFATFAELVQTGEQIAAALHIEGDS